jgi:hypothetical protein
MTYSDEHKVCWFTPKRTATRTTHTLLSKLNFVSLGTHIFFLPKERYDYQLISNIRNPYSRLVSLFFLYSLHKNNFRINFEKWCEYSLTDEQFDIEYQLRYDLIIKKSGQKFDRYITVENYSADIQSLGFVDLSKPEVKDVWEKNVLNNGYTHEFKKIQTEDRQNWQDFYNEKIAELVYSKLEDQFNFFNYDKNSWKNGTS